MREFKPVEEVIVLLILAHLEDSGGDWLELQEYINEAVGLALTNNG